MAELEEKYNIGCNYLQSYENNRDENDLARGFNIIKDCAEEGYADAQNRMGICYKEGMGVEKDDNKAMAWFIISSNNGCKKALANLALQYCYGWGVEKNTDIAIQLSKLTGDICYFFIGDLYYCHYKDNEQAFKYFLLSAETGNCRAQFKLSCMYSIGDWLKKDEEKAFEWCKLSAENNNIDAQYWLGRRYESGIGVIINIQKAIQWYTTIPNDKRAQFKLGSFYETGNGVKKDMDEAMRLYTLSANQGYTEAIDKLKSLSKFQRPAIVDNKTSIPHEQCLICIDNKKCIVFNCGHICSCNNCSKSLNKCPMCREPINEKKIVYI